MVPQVVFPANAGRVGELAVVEDLVLFYAQASALHAATQAWNDAVDSLDGNILTALPDTVKVRREVYRKLAEQALTSSGRVLPKLIALTRPWFNPRPWRREKIETVDEIRELAATGRSKAP